MTNRLKWIMKLVPVAAALLIAAGPVQGQSTPTQSQAEKALQSMDPVVLLRLISALQHGAIIAFDAQSCPVGWQEYEKASGRFLLGTAREELHGLTGGENVHTHEASTGGGHGAQRKDDDGSDSHVSVPDHYHSFTTMQAEHIPPYVGVRFCTFQS